MRLVCHCFIAELAASGRGSALGNIHDYVKSAHILALLAGSFSWRGWSIGRRHTTAQIRARAFSI